MRRLFIIVLCMTLFTITSAQEDDFPPAEALCTDEIEVIDGQFVEDDSTYLQFDNDERMVFGFHTDDYHEYPYPDDFYGISERSSFGSSSYLQPQLLQTQSPQLEQLRLASSDHLHKPRANQHEHQHLVESIL